jgi:hypothetical protein
MVKTIKILLFTVIILAGIIFGLSRIKITQEISQSQLAQQVQQNNNVQLTIIDTYRKLTNVYWEIEHYKNEKDFILFFNNLNYFQQRESKLFHDYDRVSGKDYFIIYPVIKPEKTVITNKSSNINFVSNKLEFNFLEYFARKKQ